jgi:hypothetical protein
MSIGMSYDEFWNQDVALVRVYRKADELKRIRQNEVLWLQGMYIYEALCDASPVFHAFAKKGTKPMPYAKEPYAITETEIRERKEREARAKEERFKAEFAAFAEQMRKKMPKEAHPVAKGGEMNVHND